MRMLTYRQAAARAERSVRAIQRWRKAGMPMGWEIRHGQRVRVVREDVLMRTARERLAAWPTHQYRLRRQRAERDTPKNELAE